MPITPITTVNEKSSGRLEFTVVDFNGVGIPNNQFVSATFTLKDKSTGAIVNNRTAVNVLPYINATGQFSMVLSPADTTVVTTVHKKDYEIHVATFILIISPGAPGDNLQLTEEIWIKIVNLSQTT